MPTPQPVPDRTVDLADGLQAVRRGRRALARFLGHRGLLTGPDGRYTEQADHALLVVSELVTNACRHTPGPRHLGMALRGRVLLLDVGDRSRVPPRLVPPEGRGPAGGYGFRLITELVDAWAVVPRHYAKSVRVTMIMTAPR
ncbi:ATP-binding protein [Streptomyces sp. NPDC091281]|uniref:ATP-binding protein n=1 Tax=Streptomyces sp. NPDC091281 TaxID=3365985 RepID=UPI00381F6C86